MLEGIKLPGRLRTRLTVGRLDLAAGLTPIALALLAFFSGSYFDFFSGTGFFLRMYGVALVLLGAAVLAFRLEVPNHRDYYGGLALVGLALFAFWAGADLPGMRGFSFGAGTAPRLFAGLLAVVGGVIAVIGLLTEAEPVGGYAVRGPMLVTASTLSFALLIRPMGLIVASFLTFMISAMASKEMRWVESLIMASALTVFCVLLFAYMLNLPFQLWPRF